MKAVFVVIAAADWTALHRALFTPDGKESAGVLLCGISNTKLARRLLVREFVPVPMESYVKREGYQLEVSPSFYNQVVTRCLQGRFSPVIVHSHPRHSDAWYSGSDDYGEQRLLSTLNSLLPGASPASLVVTPEAVIGREFHEAEFQPLSGITIVGLQSQKREFVSRSDLRAPPTERFDRQVRAFGTDAQALLQSLKVAVVGVGGIGSLVAEQLARAGIQDVIVVDDDKVEESNVSRLFGATPRDVGRSKVRVVAEHLKKIAGISVGQLTESAIRQGILMGLRDRDVVFLCVDNDRTRAILNRFANQYLIPVIDHGTGLDARQGRVTAAAGRVSVVGPGLVCLRCSHHIDPERIRAESMPPDERAKLQREGYIMGIEEPAPAIVTINTVVAGLGATAGLNLFLSLTGKAQPADQIYDATSGAVFPVADRHEQGCDVCDETTGVKGLGDLQIVSAYE
jgi:molybdopterin-synthase adenylyltransferase